MQARSVKTWFHILLVTGLSGALMSSLAGCALAAERAEAEAQAQRQAMAAQKAIAAAAKPGAPVTRAAPMGPPPVAAAPVKVETPKVVAVAAPPPTPMPAPAKTEMPKAVEMTASQKQAKAIEKVQAQVKADDKKKSGEKRMPAQEVREALAQALANEGAAKAFIESIKSGSFDRTSRALGVEYTLRLREIAQVLALYPTLKVSVQGHADGEGLPERQQKISERRAYMVKSVLVEAGVAQERIQAIGWGANKALADNKTEEGRALNRRVEIRNGFDMTPKTEVAPLAQKVTAPKVEKAVEKPKVAPTKTAEKIVVPGTSAAGASEVKVGLKPDPKLAKKAAAPPAKTATVEKPAEKKPEAKDIKTETEARTYQGGD